MAPRVALVTPSYIMSAPSDPRETHKAGIPSTEVPYRAIWRCNLTGSAPEARDGGRCKVLGSTSRYTGSLISVHYTNFVISDMICFLEAERWASGAADSRSDAGA